MLLHSPGHIESPRRARLLDAAIETFSRFGYRKTSMEEVARRAGISRQSVYLHFETKEELFQAAVRHALHGGLAAATAVLRDRELGIASKLSAAFDQWMGRHIGSNSTDFAEVLSEPRIKELIAGYEASFVELLTRAIGRSALGPAYKGAGLSARQLAETLYATARGLRPNCSSRHEFNERLNVAVRALCLPLENCE